MATNDDARFGNQETLAQPQQYTVPGRIEGDESMGRGPRPFIVFGAIFMFVCLAIMVGFIFFTSANLPGTRSAKARLEQKQLRSIWEGFAQLESDANGRAELQRPEIRDSAGERFYGIAIREKLLQDTLLAKLVSFNSTTDTKADRDWLDGQGGVMPPNSCSFTAPKAGLLIELLHRTGPERCVLVTFNGRNWRNYGGDEVVVLWSDAEHGEWLTFDEAQSDWKITEDEWADPAGRLFGKKAPFQFTYE